MKPNVLKLMGITHVVNVCMGRMFSQTNTSSEFYKVHDIDFFGIPAMDVPNFNLLSYLRPAADFIDEALGKKGKGLTLFEYLCKADIYKTLLYLVRCIHCI